MSDTEYRQFVQSVIDNVKKHGFPERKVAFPLVRMYEIAADKGINFNKVLVTLAEIKIGHEKTPEKIIFFPLKDEPKPQPAIDPLELLGGIDPSQFSGMDLQGLMAAASKMLQSMSPEQLAAIKSLYENLSEKEKAALSAGDFNGDTHDNKRGSERD